MFLLTSIFDYLERYSKVNYLEQKLYGEIPATANITVEVIAQAGAQISFQLLIVWAKEMLYISRR